MAFQARWSELARAGWKSQQSTGLSYDVIYIMPGKKKRGGVRGRDYFVGEEELMKYLDRMGLDISDAHPGEVSVHLDAAPATPTSWSAHADNIHGVSPHDTTYEGGGIGSAEEEDNDASALATSRQTRRNLDDDFADTDESPTTTPGRQPQLEQAATLDEEAKEESSRPQLKQVATLDEKTKEDSSRPGAVSRSQIDGSANSVIYASLDSDVEDDEGSGWNDEELTGDCDLDLGLDEDGPPQPDLLFNDSLLDSAGGGI
ncbi:hypothetical protein PI124_g4043 [Phytophthora idaei]|nr:hypothetical protein PI126_g3282 [Phytophthora idaei]KAG3251316.1 hypothetical protein PI124_g4043 [Phytophthora idaei]